MINRILKIIFALPLFIILILVLIINIKLYHSPDIRLESNDIINFDNLTELRGLKNALNNNADLDMQRLYPEGFIFMNALYGLAWCNYLSNLNVESKYFNEGKFEIQKALSKINSGQGRAPFDKDLPIPYGAFLQGMEYLSSGQKIKSWQK